MRQKQSIKKVVSGAPVVKQYLGLRAATKHIQVQQDEITGLREAVTRLEDRNLAWEKEVRQMRGDAGSLTIVWPVDKQDIISADWSKQTPQKTTSAKPPFVINWVVPPMGQASGGHADIFRTIHYLEQKGHKCRIYFYDAQKQHNLEEIRSVMKNYTPVKAELVYGTDKIADCDAIFATNWYSAYPVFNYRGRGKKYYYVQDFEPYFEPVGSYSTLAENTYRFGFRGLTLGRWLSDKLHKEYGMDCDYFELGTDSEEYHLDNLSPRKKVLFYARPVTPRRGFELGVLALEQFHKQHPEYEIQFMGWDTAAYEVPFPYVNHGILKPAQLNELYNECSAGLVLSFTNMSLLPLEMMASGCVPVVNSAEHTRVVGFSEGIAFADPAPQALADALYEAAVKDTVKQARTISDFAQKFQWAASNGVIERLLVEDLAK